MKTKILGFLSLIVLASCSTSIQPSADIRSEDISDADIHHCQIGSSFELIYKDTSWQNVRVEVNANLYDMMRAEQNGDKLNLYMSSSTRIDGDPHLRVYLCGPNLETIDLSGASTARSEGVVNAPSLRIQASGASDVDMDVDADVCSITLSGASTFMGSYYGDEATLLLSGASSMYLLGRADITRATLTGASTLEDFAYSTDILNATMSGASSIEMKVNDKINVTASGASVLIYTGSAILGEVSLSGSSEIIKR